MASSYRDLDVYKRSYRLAIQVHELSLRFLKGIQYDLGDQIRRASRSIPSNLAEGMGKLSTNKEKASFVRNALGSNDEVLFNLEFMKDSSLLPKEDYDNLTREYTICGKQLYCLLQSLNKPATSG